MIEPRLQSRDSDEFMGIARRLAEKHDLELSDARFLNNWVNENPRIWDQPVFEDVLDFIEGHNWNKSLPQSTLNALHSLLRRLSGDTDDDGEPDGPTAIAYTSPVPSISFAGKRFCFTGRFKDRSRAECEAAVSNLGADVGGMAQKTDYLVVGSRITEA